MKRFTEQALVVQAGLEDALKRISTLGEKSRALEKDADAWQARIAQADRVYRQLNTKIPNTAFDDPGGEEQVSVRVVGVRRHTHRTLQGHDDELNALKNDWSALEKLASRAKESAASVTRTLSKYANKAEFDAQRAQIDAAEKSLQPVVASADRLDASAKALKAKSDEAQKSIVASARTFDQVTSQTSRFDAYFGTQNALYSEAQLRSRRRHASSPRWPAKPRVSNRS